MSVTNGDVFIQKDGFVDRVDYEQYPREFDSPRVSVRFIDDPSVDKCVVQAGADKPVFFVGTKQLSESIVGVDADKVEQLRSTTSVHFYRHVNDVAEKFRAFERLDVEERAACYVEHETAAHAARQRVEDGNFTAGEAVALFDAFQAQAASYGQPQESLATHWSGMMA